MLFIHFIIDDGVCLDLQSLMMVIVELFVFHISDIFKESLPIITCFNHLIPPPGLVSSCSIHLGCSTF